MTTLPTVTLVSACAVDPHCPGDMYRLTPTAPYRCTADETHILHVGDLATCTRCWEANESDRYTVSRALRDEGWALIDGKLVCDTHVAPCRWCGRLTLLDTSLCADGTTIHCPDCIDDQHCDPCGRDAADEQRFAEQWEERS